MSENRFVACFPFVSDFVCLVATEIVFLFLFFWFKVTGSITVYVFAIVCVVKKAFFCMKSLDGVLWVLRNAVVDANTRDSMTRSNCFMNTIVSRCFMYLLELCWLYDGRHLLPSESKYKVVILKSSTTSTFRKDQHKTMNNQESSWSSTLTWAK